MKLVSKVTEIYCIADDFCKEYHSELNKTSLSVMSEKVCKILLVLSLLLGEPKQEGNL